MQFNSYCGFCDLWIGYLVAKGWEKREKYQDFEEKFEVRSRANFGSLPFLSW